MMSPPPREKDETRPLVHMPRRPDDEPSCPLERDHIMLSAGTVERIEKAVADGIEKGVKRVVTPELAATLWGVFFTMLRGKAKDEAGDWLIGKIKLLFKGAGYLLALFAVVYGIGGWPFVYATGKALLSRLPTP